MNVQPNIKTAILLATAFLLPSMGCFSGLTASQYRTSPIKSDTLTYSDSILAIGQPDESLRQKLDNPDALYFIGANKSYLLLEGGKELLQISKELDGNHINLDFKSHELYSKDNKIWGSFHVFYQNQRNSEKDLNLLTKLGFTTSSNKNVANNQIFKKTITVRGLSGPLIIIPKKYAQKLKIERKIYFYYPPKSAAAPNVKTTALMPLAIAADIITSPLQALFIVLVVGSGTP